MDWMPVMKKIDNYYDSLDAMLARFDRISAADRFAGTAENDLSDWQQAGRETLWRLLGLDKLFMMSHEQFVAADPGSRAPESGISGDGRIVEEDAEELPDGITRRRAVFRVDEYTYMPMYVLEPAGYKDDNSCRGTFLALAGHQGGGKYCVAGVDSIPCVRERIEKFNYDYGLKLARLGYVAVCPDPRGMGERRDIKVQGDSDEDFLSCSCRHINHMAVPMGLSVAGLCTYDNIILLDHIRNSSRWPSNHIRCLGFSGGGLQTLMLSALDERIEMSFISGYMYGYRDALLILNNNCSCNYIPGMWEHFDMGDIACMIAPRPLFIQSCADDHLNGARGMANVYEQMDIIRNAYRICGCEERLRHDVRPGDHRFHDEPLAATIADFENLEINTI